MLATIETEVPLAPLTTINLGGRASYFSTCDTIDCIWDSLQFAVKNDVAVHILGGGSNTVFADNGFLGLVIKIYLKGLTFQVKNGSVLVTAAAGENWDTVVQRCIERDLAGLENLSGIPGSVGATPIQNVGAYGQEVAQTIVRVQALDRKSKNIVSFTNKECRFEYRGSRFKYQDRDRYIITHVTYLLARKGTTKLDYPKLRDEIDRLSFNNLKPGREQLLTVREAVLVLRQRKSMVINQHDPNTQSCGSFFVNPVVSIDQLKNLQNQIQTQGESALIPTFIDSDDGVARVPAAWLIEKAGFNKGERHGDVGISDNHTLALVNYGGTTVDLLAFAHEIQEMVKSKFNITLAFEPVIVK